MSDIDSLINQLIAHGENKDELLFWKKMYPGMAPKEQKELHANLVKELAAISNKPQRT